MTSTPALDLVAIAKRCEAATPEPWHYDADRQGPSIVGPDGRVVLGSGWSETYGVAGEDADIAFTVHARSDVPALLAEVERLRAACQQVLATYDKWYPDDIFIGGPESDDGVNEVVANRNALRAALRGGGGEDGNNSPTQ